MSKPSKISYNQQVKELARSVIDLKYLAGYSIYSGDDF